MIIMYCTYDLPEEKRIDFGKELDTVAGPLVRKEDGNIQYSYFVPVDPKDKTLVLIEKWKDQKALDAHMVGSPMAKVQEIKKKYGAVTTATKYVVMD